MKVQVALASSALGMVFLEAALVISVKYNKFDIYMVCKPLVVFCSLVSILTCISTNPNSLHFGVGFCLE